MIDHGHIPREDLALYAIRGLDEEEQLHIGAHLESCSECRAHMAEATGSLALLAMSVEQRQIPSGARESFLARIGAASPSVAPVVTIAEHRPTAKSPSKARAASRWISWAVTAALILVAAGLGMELHLANTELARDSGLLKEQSAASQRAQRVLDLLTSPDAHHILLTAGSPHPAPSARAVYLASRGALILEASNLAPAPAGKTYELWIIPANGNPAIPAGIFEPDAAGEAHLVLPKIPTGVAAKAVGVTVEIASGSATPTLPIILAGAIPSEAH
jgi:hypothetical protein